MEYNLRYTSHIRDLGLKTDFDFYPNAAHTIKFGAQMTYHRFVPSALTVTGNYSLANLNKSATPLGSTEASLYVEDT